MNAGNLIVGFIAGAVAGCIAGLLLAPESGEKTRERLMGAVENIIREKDGKLA